KATQDDGGYSDSRYKSAALPVEVGVNRYAWDLLHDGARVVPGTKLDSGQAHEGVMVRPGKYTLRLLVDGRVLTREVVVRPDPRVKMTPGEFAEQEKFALQIRDDFNRVTDIV